MSNYSHYSWKDSKKNCKSKCEMDVNVDMDVKPKVDCHPVCKRDTEFDLELDFDVNPHCRIVPKKPLNRKSKCGCNTCAYTDSDTD